MLTSISQPALFAEVAVPLPIFQTFTYSVPERLSGVAPGCRALVPFGRRQVVGMVVALRPSAPASGIKPLQEVLDREALLSGPLLELGHWLAAYYFAPPGEALRVMMPPGLLQKRMAVGDRTWPGQQRLAIVEVSPGRQDLTPRQQMVLQELASRPLPLFVSRVVKELKLKRDFLNRLASRGAIRMEAVARYRSPWSGAAVPVKRHELNQEQQRILERIGKGLSAPGEVAPGFLIHGITGSGKTEIYLNAIALTLSLGKTALMLVPEIGLTPQMLRSFRGWFGEQVAVLHSALSEGERFDQWWRIRQGRARVVVGTRSAVFAPLTKLGMIIVDEEHDGSYKQEDLPRYHARETALKRGQIEKALVVLGSATPQLESYYQSAVEGRLQYQILSSRVLERPLAAVHVLDMRVEFQKRGREILLSELLRQAIEDRLCRKEQVLILLNRRGYSAVLLCRSCGHTEGCGNCSISLTYHRHLNRLICHYCGYARSLPTRCAECGKEYIYFLGQGTEKVQEVLQKLFPAAVVDRLDRDTTRRKGSFERILSSFSAGRTDILIGTQMIAKGHDFPAVTLVGVLAAEQVLKLEDFRAAERTFQLLTQVAGRAGRGERPGTVIIQTYFPNHYSLRYACAQDYQKFFEQEIQYRRRFRYPPFTALANLVVHDRNRGKAEKLACQLAATLLENRARFSSQRRMRVLGPAAAALERIKGQYRFQVLIKTTSRRELRQVLEKSVATLRQKRAGLKKILIDIDPLTLM